MKINLIIVALFVGAFGCNVEDSSSDENLSPQVEGLDPLPPPGGWYRSKGPIGCAGLFLTGKSIPVACTERPWREEDWSRGMVEKERPHEELPMERVLLNQQK